MDNFARVGLDGIVIETFMELDNISISDVFPENIINMFQPAPDIVRRGWIAKGGSWSEPLPPAPLPTIYPIIKVIPFQMLFTADEAAKISVLRPNDAKLESFWKLIDDPRTDIVNLNLSSVQTAIEYSLDAVKAAGLSIDVPTRLAAVLSGLPI